MHTRKPEMIPSSEITPREIYLRRREFLAGTAALGFASALPGFPAMAAPLQGAKSQFSTDEPQTPLKT